MAEIAGWSLAILLGLCAVAVLMWRQYRFLDSVGQFLPLTVILAVAAALAENSCISWYQFYSYSPDWGLFVGHVPLQASGLGTLCFSGSHFRKVS